MAPRAGVPRDDSWHWRSTGCSYHSDRLTCPFPYCRYDRPRQLVTERVEARVTRARELREGGATIAEIAASLGRSERRVFAYLAQSKDVNKTLAPAL